MVIDKEDAHELSEKVEVEPLFEADQEPLVGLRVRPYCSARDREEEELFVGIPKLVDLVFISQHLSVC